MGLSLVRHRGVRTFAPKPGVIVPLIRDSFYLVPTSWNGNDALLLQKTHLA
jgi:hypothetical protein